MPKKIKAKKALALISGGFDSPIAAYRMMKEGWDLEFLLYFPEPYVSDREKEITVSSIKQVKAKLGITKPLKLFIVNNGKAINELTSKLSGEIQYVVLRRIMFAAAAELARREKCSALVTGENLGQVASQTLDNLAAISTASALPIMRPLLCFDKEETIDIARDVGTFDFSKDHSDCSLGAIPKPSTKVKESDAKKAEKAVGAKKLISEILKTAKVVEV
jgi:thiamine biosynthesis protein ThiI